MKAKNCIDLTGQQFGNLRVLREEGVRNRQLTWLCKCDCGNEVIVRGSQLRGNRTKSCGCLRKNRCNWTGEGEISGSYWFSIKSHAKQRDRDLDIDLKYIWRLFLRQQRRCALTGVELSFVSDYRNNKREQTASLDRIDSDKGYVRGNVQWVHKDINKLKQSFSEKRLIELCQMICENRRRCG